MAISFYTGIPRSGKSYKAVSKIYDLFVEKEPTKIDSFFTKIKLKSTKKEDYLNCYTNINQFNYEISPKILKFEFDEIYDKLNLLYSLYMDKNPDNILIEKAIELNLYKSLFVIDECHNYLKSKENPVLVWWFTYHGHLYQDIILITQDLKLVNDEYKRVAEFFYKAVPQRLRFSKNTFKYRQYSSWQMYQKDYINTESVKARQEVFSLYVSGATVNTKPIIYKYIFIFIVLILILLYFFNDFLNSIEPNKNELQNQVPTIPQIQTNTNSNNSIETNEATQNFNNQISEQQPTNIELKEEETNLKLFKFTCFKLYCYYKQDNNYTLEIPYSFLVSLTKDMDKSKKFTLSEKNRTVIYLLANEEKLNFTKGVQNETKQNDSNILTGAVNQPK